MECENQLETLPHVLCHCGLYAATHRLRQNGILERLAAVSRLPGDLRVNHRGPRRGRRSRGLATWHSRDARAVKNRPRPLRNRDLRKHIPSAREGEVEQDIKKSAPRRLIAWARLYRARRRLRCRRLGILASVERSPAGPAACLIRIRRPDGTTHGLGNLSLVSVPNHHAQTIVYLLLEKASCCTRG